MSSGLPMGDGLRLVWFLDKVLLVLARFFAWLLRGLPDVRRPPDGLVCLPQDDPSDDRVAESIAALREYELIPAVDLLGLDPGLRWRHKTVRRVPRRERYTLGMIVPKALLLAALRPRLESERRWSDPEQPRRIYGLIGRPEAFDHADDDRWFARLRVQGPNPIFLRGGLDPEGLVRLGLTRDNAAALGLLEGSPEAWRERLFYVDYREPLAGVRPAEGRRLPGCLGLFEQRNGELHPLGIQIDGRDREPLFRPDGSPAWRLARLFFNSADFMIHEVVSHFLWTHATAETFALRTARTLSWRHPLRRLLAPHLCSSVQQNRNAGPLLIADGGLFDRVFAGGDAKHRLLEWGDRRWTYDHMIFPRQIAERGVEGLVDFPYRDDGLKVWAAVEEYASAYVDAWYRGDEKRLRSDREVRCWSQELTEALGDRGFPEIRDLATLKEVVAGILFNPVAHNLVNALQYDVYGCPLVAPVCMGVPVPASADEVDEQTLLRALPDVGRVLQTVRATYGFTFRYDRLGENLKRTLPASSLPLAARFRSRLAALDREIAEADRARPVPYRISRPSRLANAVDA